LRAGYTVRKFLHKIRRHKKKLRVSATFGGLNEASRRNEWVKFFELRGRLNVPLEGEMNELCCLE